MAQTEKIRVIDETFTEVTKERDPDSQWSGEDTYTSHDVMGIVKCEDDKEYHDLTVGFPIDEKKDYFLLYVIWSTGDSFHHEDGRITFLELYEDGKIASEAASMIEKDFEDYENNKQKKEKWSIKVPDGSGGQLDVYCNWKGYFDRLTAVHVDRVTVLSRYYHKRGRYA